MEIELTGDEVRVYAHMHLTLFYHSCCTIPTLKMELEPPFDSLNHCTGHLTLHAIGSRQGFLAFGPFAVLKDGQRGFAFA